MLHYCLKKAIAQAQRQKPSKTTGLIPRKSGSLQLSLLLKIGIISTEVGAGVLGRGGKEKAEKKV